MSEGVVTKRKRIVLTIESKLKIIERLHKGESAPKLANEFNVGVQTVRDIFRKKDELLKFVSAADTFDAVTSRKTIKGSTFDQIDSALYEWFKQESSEGHHISTAMLAEKAQWFHKQLKIQEPFIASQGWLHRFRSRHGIQWQKSVGGSEANLTDDVEHNVGGHKEEINSHSSAPNSLHSGDIKHWMEGSHYHHDEDQIKGIEIIFADSLVSVDMVEGRSCEDSDFAGDLTTSKSVPLEKALNSADTLLTYLEQEDDTSFSDIFNVRKIRMSIKMKMTERNRQMLMTDFFPKL